MKKGEQFGYNGVKGGMSGVGFVMGWSPLNTGMGDKLEKARTTRRRRRSTRRSPSPEGQPERRADAGQRGHARHAESREI